MEEKTLTEKITAYIEPKSDVEIDYDGFKVKVNEDVDINDLLEAVDIIVSAVEGADFDYTLYDIVLAKYLIKLFTNIPVPQTVEGFDDHETCYKIAVGLNLAAELVGASPIVAEHISFIETNVWRNLEYKKTAKPNEELYKALAEFYSILDDLNKVVEMNENIDIEKLLAQIAETYGELQEVKDLASDKTE